MKKFLKVFVTAIVLSGVLASTAVSANANILPVIIEQKPNDDFKKVQELTRQYGLNLSNAATSLKNLKDLQDAQYAVASITCNQKQLAELKAAQDSVYAEATKNVISGVDDYLKALNEGINYVGAYRNELERIQKSEFLTYTERFY